ncbi:MAG: tRNA (N6-isopentenyl adenosine(37)-C2)-methylthiotransferase MiaB [Kordiimonadaceae bacterium]|nr:tRNA (N6-isopentenyl adenosine(37)-C2)-methylthiotransferase MiaB [Kordiimonadaceae bacterium]
MSKKVFVKTYGCQMNVYDSNRMVNALKPHGYEITDTPEDAYLVILNTCHIREKAAEKVYSEIGRLKQTKMAKAAKGENMFIAIAGCVAQAEGAEMMKRAPAVDLVLGPQTYHRLPDMMKSAEEQRAAGRSSSRVLDTEFPADTKFDHLPEESDFKSAAAFLTIQEGCDKFCAFCVVPYTRGAEYSRSVAEIVAEAEHMARNGVVEITLLGQNVNAYHGDDGAGGTVSLAALIREVAKIKEIGRIRYTTSHPRDMDDELIAVHKDLPECMPYLHLPVQSGSDAILKAMNRQHTREDYFKTVDKLREECPNIALSSDFIVGFPGETDQDFEDTMDLVRRVKYAQAYSFKYSPRPGTPASVIEEQVPEEVKVERLARLQDLLLEHQQEFNESMVGAEMDILLEREGKQAGQLIGRSPYLQAVHVDLSKEHNAMDESAERAYSDYMGKLVRVKIAEAGPRSLKGELVSVVS